MEMIKLIFTLYFGLFLMTSCISSKEDALDEILASEELYIQQITYGGIGGYTEEEFHFKKGTFGDYLLIIDEGTDYQTFIQLDDKESLRSFIIEAYESDTPGKDMSNSCLTGIDHEYIIQSGLTKLTFRPNIKSDSLFYNILSQTN